MLDRLQACDLVLIEGFKDGDFPKLEVWRAAPAQPTLWPHWPGIVAIASDAPPPASAAAGPAPARLALADTASIPDLVLRHAATQRRHGPGTR